MDKMIINRIDSLLEHIDLVLKDTDGLSIEDIEKQNFILSTGLYVELESQELDDFDYDNKMKELTANLKELIDEGQKSDLDLKRILGSIGYDL